MKKKPNFLAIFLKLSLLAFGIIYIMMENGYYERKMSREVTLTEKNIRKFEQDVKNNKIVDISSYNIDDDKDYSTKVSRFGTKLTDDIGKIVLNGADGIVDVLKSLFWKSIISGTLVRIFNFIFSYLMSILINICF